MRITSKYLTLSIGKTNTPDYINPPATKESKVKAKASALATQLRNNTKRGLTTLASKL